MNGSAKPPPKSKRKASTSSIAPPRKLGRAGEILAATYLSRSGYQVIARNFRAGHDELDLVAVDAATGTLVFVEVKTRQRDNQVDPTVSISPWKCFKLRRAVAAYLRQCHHWYAHWRLDVITIVGHRLRHYRNVTW